MTLFDSWTHPARLVFSHATDPGAGAGFGYLQDACLDSVQAKVDIVDVHAEVWVEQTFTNPRTFPIEASYTFPINEGAAVCGFEMIRGDGRKISGQVMEKSVAQNTFETAVEQGKTASLAAEQTKDVFTISVGNIDSKETVKVRLRLVQELIDDERRDQVRFTFPRQWAQRYGQGPEVTAGLAHDFDIVVDIQQAGPITSVSCPSSHPIEVTIGHPHGGAAAGPSGHSASVKLTRQSKLLEKDFTLVVSATNLDQPRCFVEHDPVASSSALALTFVPRFTLPPIPDGQDFVFLVDRSGSMAGTSIKLVREALVVLLRGLPTSGTTFNVWSFGSTHNALFRPSSKAYTQQTLDEATRHIDSMEADYGGTEIASALNSVYAASSSLSRPSNVFLLTDGEAWDVETCASHARLAAARSPHFVRTFVVGIGSGVSTNMCNTIARAGDGVAIYVADNEPFTGKLGRLVRAARTPPVRDIAVRWTDPDANEAVDEADFEMVDVESSQEDSEAEVSRPAASIPLFDSTHVDDEAETGPPPTPKVEPLPPSSIQYAPYKATGIFPGTRTQFWAIIDSASRKVPRSVTVTGKVSTTGALVEIDVAVTPTMASSALFIHALAAKALITDLEGGMHHALSRRFKPDTALGQAHLMAEIIQIGVRYSLTSSHTSFVAVDEDGPPIVRLRPQPATLFGAAKPQIMAKSAFVMARAAPPPPCASALAPAPQFSLAPPGSAIPRGTSAFGSAKSSGFFGSLRSAPHSPALPDFASPLAGGALHTPTPSAAETSNADQAPATVVVARLQAFNGKFNVEPKLLSALGVDPDKFNARLRQRPEVAQEIAATALAIVWFEKQSGHDDGTEDLKEKAEGFAVQALGGSDARLQEVKDWLRDLIVT